jgi:hypothetical protein
MGLGISKDLEPLVRAWRRLGGTVEVTGSNHVKWTMPDGSVLRTGLTMNSRSARQAQRDIERALAASHPAGAPSRVAPPMVVAAWRPVPDGRGKFHLVDQQGEPLRSAAGFPRTFSTRAAASGAATRSADG